MCRARDARNASFGRMSLGCLSIRVGGARSPAIGVQQSTTSDILKAMLASKLPALLPPRPNRTMICGRRRMTAYRLIVAGLVCGIGVTGSAQTGSRLPPTPTTSISNPNAMSPPIAAAPTRADTLQRHRARVTYANGMLEVRADNSSLNQILRDISRQTGMKIVGGVADQRVFGSYGPAPAATVLQTLLDGTGTNILLQESRTHAPEQLVLTPQTGGPTPPPPSSPSYDVTETEPELPLPGRRAASDTGPDCNARRNFSSRNCGGSSCRLRPLHPAEYAAAVEQCARQPTTTSRRRPRLCRSPTLFP